MIEIYWDDLTKEKQTELLEIFGENGNWDVFPIAVIPEPEPECEHEQCELSGLSQPNAIDGPAM